MTNVLEKIVADKRVEIELRKSSKPLASFKDSITLSTRSLEKALSSAHADFILECKKASPSKGLIREDFNLADILNQYKDYASAISVLTDKKYFQGDSQFLTQASQTVSQPILCKDFFIDEYQIFEARSFGADAILLMLSVLNDQQYSQLAKVATLLDLDILTEVHEQSELDRAIKLNAKIIGINNRNLKDLTIDLANTEKLAKQIPSDRIVISESGISTHKDVNRLSPLVNGFLVGSSIMQQADIRLHCKSLIFGRTKICGITRLEDAIEADNSGAIYAGFIFYPKSKRFISLSDAKEITDKLNLKFVGVFVDQDIELVVEHAQSLNLDAVQLHGSESAEYIQQLKKVLAQKNLITTIWKSIAINDGISFISDFELDSNIDRYLLDTFSLTEHGGTGKSFDWKLLDKIKQKIDLDKIILAGGINNDNANQAMQKNTHAIDLSSGVETSPGIKCKAKIKQLYQTLRG